MSPSFPHTCYMPRQSLSSLFDYPNNPVAYIRRKYAAISQISTRHQQLLLYSAIKVLLNIHDVGFVRF
jgi:hypothetical protein